MLNSILDAKITEKIVRLGAQSTDERIGEYSLRNLERTFEDATMSAQIRREYGAKKRIEESMYKVMEDIQIPEPTEDQIKEYLQTNWPEHLSMMYDPPFWIVEYAVRLWQPDDEEGEWKVQGKKGKGKQQSHLMGHTYYGLWKRGLDIAFIQPPQPRSTTFGPSKKQKKQGGQNVQPTIVLIPPTQKEQEMYRERMFEFFYELGYGDSVPPVPTGSRLFVQLQDSPAVWAMSLEERQRLAEHWEEDMRRLAYHNFLGEYRNLRRQYDEACEKYEAVSDEVRVYSMFECCSANCPCRGSVVC
jgi:hypothetical protein